MKNLLPMCLLVCACHGRSLIPEPDDCRSPSANAEVRGLEMGWADPFTAYENGEELRISTGGQGTPMIMLGLRIKGTDGPSCLGQHTTVTDASGEVIGELDVPIKTYENGNFRETRGIPILLSPGPRPGDPLTIETTAHGKTANREVYRYGADSGGTGL